jgi:hypothetical protein
MNEIPEQLKGYEWASAFCYAGERNADDVDWEERGYCDGNYTPTAVIGDEQVSTTPFTRMDVAEVIACEAGENEGPGWIGLFRLKDGRYASLEAGCDYTGWDCQSGGDANVGTTKEDVIRFGLTLDARRRLGLTLPDDEVAS